MKLNMNEPATIMLSFTGLFLIIIPGLLKLFSLRLGFHFFPMLITISITAGVLILFILFILVAIELRQDRQANQLAIEHKNLKIKISDRDYECPSCGNRKLKATDGSCPICGQEFIS